MARYLRKSTAATIKLGPFVAPGDGLTVYTSGGFTVKVSANGGALGARHDATAIAHDADGYYAVALDATDTAAVGRLRVEVPGSTGSYLPAWDDFVVLDGAVYDVLFGSVAPSTLGGVAQTGDSYARIGAAGAGLTALGDARIANLDAAITSRMASYTQPTGFLAATFPTTVASPTNITAGTITTATNLTNLPAAPTDWLTAAAVKADAVTKIQSGLSTYAGGDTSGTTTLLSRLTSTRAGLLDNLDAAVSTRLAAAGYTAPPATVTLAASQPNYAPAKAGDAMTLTAAYDAAKTAAQASTALSTAVWTSTKAGYLDAAVSSVSTGGVSAGAIATAVWQDLLSGSDFATVGSIGKLLKDDVDAAISSRSTYGGSDTSGTTTLLSRLSSTRAGYLDNLSGGAVALASQIPANFTTATFASAGVFSANALQNAPTGSGGGGGASLLQIQGELDTRGLTTAFTGSVGTNLDAKVSTLATATTAAAIKAKTDNLPASPAAVGSAMTLTTAYDPAKTAAQAGDAMTLTSAGYNAAADALLDRANGVETGETPRQWMRKARAVLMGVCTAGGVFKRKDGTTTSLTVNLDGNGARTSVTDGSN